MPCNLQPAIAGLNSQARSLAALPEHVQEALKPGSHAIGAYEPGQDRKVAAVSNVFMCREDTWVEQVGHGKSLRPRTSKGARLD